MSRFAALVLVLVVTLTGAAVPCPCAPVTHHDTGQHACCHPGTVVRDTPQCCLKSASPSGPDALVPPAAADVGVAGEVGVAVPPVAARTRVALAAAVPVQPSPPPLVLRV
jgi:hypothetical protein